MSERSVDAVVSLDCVHKLRIHYRLGRPFEETMLAAFRDLEIEIRRFSNLVAGSKDQFVISDRSRWRAAGVIGSPRISVTYRKQDDVSINEFQNRLASLGFDSPRYCGPPPQQAA